MVVPSIHQNIVHGHVRVTGGTAFGHYRGSRSSVLVLEEDRVGLGLGDPQYLGKPQPGILTAYGGQAIIQLIVVCNLGDS